MTLQTQIEFEDGTFKIFASLFTTLNATIGRKVKSIILFDHRLNEIDITELILTGENIEYYY